MGTGAPLPSAVCGGGGRRVGPRAGRRRFRLRWPRWCGCRGTSRSSGKVFQQGVVVDMDWRPVPVPSGVFPVCPRRTLEARGLRNIAIPGVRTRRNRYDGPHAPMVSVKRPAARLLTRIGDGTDPSRRRAPTRHHRPCAQGPGPGHHAQAGWEVAGGDHRRRALLPGTRPPP